MSGGRSDKVEDLTIRAILLNWNSREQATRCLQRLRDSVGVAVDVLLVDNGSTGNDVSWFREQLGEHRVLALAENTGYAGGMNAGISFWRDQGHPDPVLIVTPDAVVGTDTLRLLAAELVRTADAGIAAPAMVYARGTPPAVFAGGAVEFDRARVRLLSSRSAHPRDVDYVDGCCMLCRPAALASVGGFDEEYFIYFEEIDLCGRVREAGWRIRVVPAAEVDHPKEIGTLPPYYYYYMARNRYRFWRKNHGIGFGRVALQLALESARGWANAARALVLPSRRSHWRRALRDARLQTRALVQGTRDHLGGRYGRMPEDRMPGGA